MDRICKKTKPHDAHYHIAGFFWPREVWCPGVPSGLKSVWEMANPALSDRVKANADIHEDVAMGRKSVNQARAEIGLQEIKLIPAPPHRHFYKLTDVLKFDDFIWNRQVVPIDVIAWQCDCYSVRTMNRIKLKEEMMPQWGKVEQTWPS